MNILFIGIGNMGGAILESIASLKQKDFNLYVAKHSDKTFQDMSKKIKINLYEQNKLKDIDIIFYGVKPYQIIEATKEHAPVITEKTIIVSMAAGVTLDKLQSIFGKDKKIIRIMPNMPIIVQEGMTALCSNKNILDDDISIVKKLLEKSSKVAIISETKMDAFIGLAGSSPAFGFIFLEAMADAGVKYGLSRSEALNFASQALLGASKMVQQLETNPANLKDKICSPGGTTIEGVCELERLGFRNSIISAVSKTIEKSILMNNKKE